MQPLSLRDPRLSNAEVYNIATALRGPDDQSGGGGHLKIVTTTVLRSFIQEALGSNQRSDDGDCWNPNVTPASYIMETQNAEVNWRDRSEILDWARTRDAAAANEHYMRHFWVALDDVARYVPEAQEYARWLSKYLPSISRHKVTT